MPFTTFIDKKIMINNTSKQLIKKKIQDLPIGLNLINDVHILDQKYFYEMSSFLYSGVYCDLKSRMKYTYRMLDMKKDLISNDITGKFSNELKTIFERNLHLYKFMRKMLFFRPLNNFGLKRKKIKDITIRQSELNYFSGKYTPFRILLLDVNKKKLFYTERSVYTIIPTYAKNLFYNAFPVAKNNFYNVQKYIMRSRNRRSLKIFFSGFKFYIKNKKYIKNRTRSKPYFFLPRRRRKLHRNKPLKFYVKKKLFKKLRVILNRVY